MSIFSGLGIDISDHHIRIVRASFFGSVKDIIEIELKEGLVVDEKVQNFKELARILRERLSRENWANKKTRAVLLVPESRVFSYSMAFSTPMDKFAMDSQAKARAAKEMPIPFSRARVTVSNAKKVRGEVRSTVYAAEEEVITGLSAILDPEAFSLIAMEANTKALFRFIQFFGKGDVTLRDPSSVFGIIDVGRLWATVSIYAGGGSNLFSRTLSFKTPFSKGAVDEIDRVVDEIVLYFQQREITIEKFIVAGLEGGDPLFKKKGRFKQIGDFLTVSGVGKQDMHKFGAAIGAAIRSAQPWRFSYQHNFFN